MAGRAALFPHADVLGGLDRAASLAEKVGAVHAEVRRRFPFIARVALASYDADVGRVRTLADSSVGGQPLAHYEAPLASAPSLRHMLATRRPRVVNDLSAFGDGGSEHTVRIRAHYRASYTLPVSLNGQLCGFLFFDSTRPDVFTPDVLADLDVFAHLLSTLATHELSTQRLLAAALTTVAEMVHRRDPETGAHLQRMARFARLIAEELARRGAAGVDDEFVERVFLFAPLHDVGKIAIPDVILRKPGRLTREEYGVMKTHAEQGARIVDAVIANFRFGTLPFMDMLRHVAELHHEAMDGSGYPRGLRGAAIPLEARIVAVADVFDALSRGRVYKAAWPKARVLATLRRLAGHTLDPACVDALSARWEDAEAIQERFRDGPVRG